MNYTDCSLCGIRLLKASIKKHENNLRCRTTQLKQKLRADMWRPVAAVGSTLVRFYRTDLQAAGLLRCENTGFDQGRWRVEAETWIPNWLWQLCARVGYSARDSSAGEGCAHFIMGLLCYVGSDDTRFRAFKTTLLLDQRFDDYVEEAVRDGWIVFAPPYVLRQEGRVIELNTAPRITRPLPSSF